jgi:hypothetical protein
MSDKKHEQCAHPSCVCTRSDDSKFCSAYCEGASDHPDITCNCGHAGCVTDLTAEEPHVLREIVIEEIVIESSPAARHGL